MRSDLYQYTVSGVATFTGIGGNLGPEYSFLDLVPVRLRAHDEPGVVSNAKILLPMMRCVI